jgi:hypothetical protein
MSSSLDFARSLTNKKRKAESEVPMDVDQNPNVQSVKKTFIHGNNAVIRNGTYKGYLAWIDPNSFYGKTMDVQIDGKRVSVPASNVEPKTAKIGATVQMRKGAFKGKQAQVIQVYPARITAYINALGKNISVHQVKENGEFKTRFLSPQDIFYFDIELKNGNFFQVQKVLEDKTIVGTELANNQFVDKTISSEEIRKTLDGFKFDAVSNLITNTEETEFVSESNQDTQDAQDIDEDTDNIEHSGYAEEQTDIDGDNIEYKASYKDSERVTFRQNLTEQEKKYKTQISKILKYMNLNDSELDLYEMLYEIESSIKIIKNQLKKSSVQQDFWIDSDERYIIAAVVFFNIVKHGYSYLLHSETLNILESYIKELSNNKYFVSKDAKFSIFLTNGWSKKFTINKEEIDSLRRSKNVLSLFGIMLNNVIRHLQSHLEWPSVESILSEIEQNVSTTEYIPLGNKSNKQKYIFVQNLIGVQDFTKITQEAFKVYWGKLFQPLLTQIIDKLQTKVASANNKTTEIVYNHIIRHIENAPFELTRLYNIIKNDKGNSLDKIKYEKLMFVWNQVMNSVNQVYLSNADIKGTQLRNIKKQRVEKQNKRELAMKNSVTNLFGDLSLDDIEDKMELV